MQPEKMMMTVFNEKSISSAAVVSRKSRSVVKQNRIMKLYTVNDMIGQLYGHVTLNRWKLSKETPFPILKERTRVGKTILALLA